MWEQRSCKVGSLFPTKLNGHAHGVKFDNNGQRLHHNRRSHFYGIFWCQIKISASTSFCWSLQVGTGSHDHQQQHQQTHLLLPWLTDLNVKLNLFSTEHWGSVVVEFGSVLDLLSTSSKWKLSILTKISWMTSSDSTGLLVSTDISSFDHVGKKMLTAAHPFLFSLASLETQSAYDNHRLLILSTGRDENFSQRFWELTSLLGLSSWCHTQQRQIWTICCWHKETEMVIYILQC